jgi:hypothetical protein
MNMLGYIGSVLVASGSVAWTLTTVAGRFDRAFESDQPLPAPANDDRARPEARSRRASGIGSAMSMLLQNGLSAFPVRLRGMVTAHQGGPLPESLGLNPVMDLAASHYYKRCAICGEPLGQYKAFVLRPVAAVGRRCVIPPTHQDCAKFRAKELSHRRGGVMMVWVTRTYEVVPDGDAAWVHMGDAEQVFWYLGEHCATRDEVRASFEAALPALYADAHAAGEQAVLELDTMVARATRFFPRHGAAAHIG